MIARRLRLLMLLPCVAMGLAQAQTPVPARSNAPPPPPLSSSPTPSPAPPPPDVMSDPDLEPQVTIVRKQDQVVEEVRVNGQLRYLRITPQHGRPYFLIPDGNGQTFIRRDSLDSSLKVPMWVLFSF